MDTHWAYLPIGYAVIPFRTYVAPGGLTGLAQKFELDATHFSQHVVILNRPTPEFYAVVDRSLVFQNYSGFELCPLEVTG